MGPYIVLISCCI